MVDRSAVLAFGSTGVGGVINAFEGGRREQREKAAMDGDRINYDQYAAIKTVG